MDNLEFLFAAFAIIWAVLFGYVLVLDGRFRKLQRELAQMKAAPPAPKAAPGGKKK